MGGLSPWHWLIILAVLVLLFGAKRLPDAARSLGRSARILKAEVQEMSGDDGASAKQTPSAQQALPPQAGAPEQRAPGSTAEGRAAGAEPPR